MYLKHGSVIGLIMTPWVETCRHIYNWHQINCVLTELTLRLYKWKHVGIAPIKINTYWLMNKHCKAKADFCQCCSKYPKRYTYTVLHLSSQCKEQCLLRNESESKYSKIYTNFSFQRYKETEVRYSCIEWQNKWHCRQFTSQKLYIIRPSAAFPCT
jgi:hypothetical protein